MSPQCLVRSAVHQHKLGAFGRASDTGHLVLLEWATKLIGKCSVITRRLPVSGVFVG